MWKLKKTDRNLPSNLIHQGSKNCETQCVTVQKSVNLLIILCKNWLSYKIYYKQHTMFQDCFEIHLRRHCELKKYETFLPKRHLVRYYNILQTTLYQCSVCFWLRAMLKVLVFKLNLERKEWTFESFTKLSEMIDLLVQQSSCFAQLWLNVVFYICLSIFIQSQYISTSCVYEQEWNRFAILKYTWIFFCVF